MPKLGVFSGKEVCKILKTMGFESIRQTGSHIIMQKKISSSTITVPVPNHKIIKKGTLHSIIRQSKIDKIHFTA